jgi:SAM-dependent methyltransferase
MRSVYACMDGWMRCHPTATRHPPPPHTHTTTVAPHQDLCKCVDTYVTVKRNQNQICWRWRKVTRSSPRPALFRTFLDQQQYSPESISRYEAVFGRGYVSTGGEATTKQLVALLGLRPGQRVLDLGCGIGGACVLVSGGGGSGGWSALCRVALSCPGSPVKCELWGTSCRLVQGVSTTAAPLSQTATPPHLNNTPSRNKQLHPPPKKTGGDFLMSDTYGVHVHALDLSVNMILLALERAAGRATSNGGGVPTSVSDLAAAAAAAAGAGAAPQHDVTFEVSDALTRDFAEASFDVVYSRDMLLHVEEKEKMFARLVKWLKPGGKVLITDYARWGLAFFGGGSCFGMVGWEGGCG